MELPPLRDLGGINPFTPPEYATVYIYVYIYIFIYIYISYLEKILKTTVSKILERIFASFLAGARR